MYTNLVINDNNDQILNIQTLQLHLVKLMIFYVIEM